MQTKDQIRLEYNQIFSNEFEPVRNFFKEFNYKSIYDRAKDTNKVRTLLKKIFTHNKFRKKNNIQDNVS